MVTSVTFSLDGRYVAASGGDPLLRTGAVIVFEAVGGKEVSRLKFEGPVNAVAFSPDGRYLAAASGDVVLREGAASVLEAVGKKENVAVGVPKSGSGGRVQPPTERYVAAASWDNAAGVFEAAG